MKKEDGEKILLLLGGIFLYTLKFFNSATAAANTNKEKLLSRIAIESASNDCKCKSVLRDTSGLAVSIKACKQGRLIRL